MPAINNLLPDRIISAFGYMLLNSLWQGIIISILLGIALLVLRKGNPKVRYALSYSALMIMLLLSLNSFINKYNSAGEIKNNLSSKVYLSDSNLDTNGKINLALYDKPANNDFSITEYLQQYRDYFADQLPWIVLFYFIGVIFFVLKAMGGFLYIQRLKHYKVFTPDEHWKNLVNKLSRQLKIKRNIKLLESALINVPMLIGYFKPVILMPLGLISGLPQQQIEALIIHELAHVKRFDYVLNIIQYIFEIVFFYHPAVWWISNIIKREREYICDDIAAEICKDNLVYSKALLSITEIETKGSTYAMTLFKNKSELLGRVKRMIHRKENNFAYAGKLTAIAMILFMSVLVVTACSSTSDDYSYDYSDDYGEFVNEYPDGRHTIRFEDDNDNYWRVRLNDGDIVSVHKNGDLLSDDDLKEAESFIRRHIRKTHRELNHANRSFARGNSHFRFDSEELDEAMDELRDNLKNIGVKTQVHINKKELHEAMRELKRNLDNIHVSINDENIRMDFDNDFDFDFDFDDNINIDIDLGDFGEKMGKFGEAMGELGESVKDCNIDLDEFEDNMEDFSEKMNDLGFDMNELKYEMKRLKRFLLDVKEELVDDGYIDDMDDSVTLELDDGDLYIDNERVSDDVRRKYEAIYEKYYDEKPDDDWRIEL